MEIATYLKQNAERIAGWGSLLLVALVSIITLVATFALLSASVTMFVNNAKWFVPASQAILILIGGALIVVLLFAVIHRLQQARRLHRLTELGLNHADSDRKEIIALLKDLQPMNVHLVGDVRIASETKSLAEMSKTSTTLTTGPFNSTGASAPNPGEGEKPSGFGSTIAAMIEDYHRAILKRAADEGLTVAKAAGYGNCDCGVDDCPVNNARRAAGLYIERSAAPATQAPVAAPAAPATQAPVAARAAPATQAPVAAPAPYNVYEASEAPPPPPPRPMPAPAPAPAPAPDLLELSPPGADV